MTERVATADENAAPSRTVAFVTVSYGPDRERCELLCRSLDELAPSPAEHWIIVDRADRRLFAGLESASRRLLVTEDVVPARVWRLGTRRVGLRSNVFLQTRGKPIRGWLVQQLAKLAIARHLSADVIVHADSDVALVRRFEPSSVFDDAGRVRFFRVRDEVDGRLPSHVTWHRTAENLLGIPAQSLPLADYITSLVPWKRTNAVALLDFIDDRHGSWFRTAANAWDVSEYVLYGRFVSDVLRDEGGQFATATSLCRDYWGSDPLSTTQIEELLDSMSPDQVALSITAKAGMKPESYAALLQREWARAHTASDLDGTRGRK